MKKTTPQKIIPENQLVLQLYVSGMSMKSMQAIENIKRLCEEHVKEPIELEIIDIYKNPETAVEQHIVFSPSLIKRLPLPEKILVGTLSDTEKVIRALGINPEK